MGWRHPLPGSESHRAALVRVVDQKTRMNAPKIEPIFLFVHFSASILALNPIV